MSDSQVFSSSVVGADVHKKNIVCCARRLENGIWKKYFATFSTTKNDIFRMAEWCKKYEPDFIIMESTGVYWMSPLNYLERSGLTVYIVNPSSVKGMKGKKTDKTDAEWLATKGNDGSFKPSYIPTDIWRRLRDVSRNITTMIQCLTRLKNRELKMFLAMGYRLDSVFSDTFGLNAQRAKDAILAGKTPNEVLSSIETSRLKASREELIEAFNGDLDPERVSVIKTNRTLMNVLRELIIESKQSIQTKVKELEPRILDGLQTIPGIDVDHATTLMIEFGGHKFLEEFDSAAKFASWLGVCPGNKESGGKHYKCKSGHGNRAARRCLCEAAHAASRTNGTSLQSRIRSQRAKIGTKKAIISAAHLLARLAYTVSKNGTPYKDPEVDYEAAAFDKAFKRYVLRFERFRVQKCQRKNTNF